MPFYLLILTILIILLLSTAKAQSILLRDQGDEIPYTYFDEPSIGPVGLIGASLIPGPISSFGVVSYQVAGAQNLNLAPGTSSNLISATSENQVANAQIPSSNPTSSFIASTEAVSANGNPSGYQTSLLLFNATPEITSNSITPSTMPPNIVSFNQASPLSYTATSNIPSTTPPNNIPYSTPSNPPSTTTSTIVSSNSASQASSAIASNPTPPTFMATSGVIINPTSTTPNTPNSPTTATANPIVATVIRTPNLSLQCSKVPFSSSTNYGSYPGSKPVQHVLTISKFRAGYSYVSSIKQCVTTIIPPNYNPTANFFDTKTLCDSNCLDPIIECMKQPIIGPSEICYMYQSTPFTYDAKSEKCVKANITCGQTPSTNVWLSEEDCYAFCTGVTSRDISSYKNDDYSSFGWRFPGHGSLESQEGDDFEDEDSRSYEYIGEEWYYFGEDDEYNKQVARISEFGDEDNNRKRVPGHGNSYREHEKLGRRRRLRFGGYNSEGGGYASEDEDYE